LPGGDEAAGGGPVHAGDLEARRVVVGPIQGTQAGRLHRLEGGGEGEPRDLAVDLGLLGGEPAGRVEALHGGGDVAPQLVGRERRDEVDARRAGQEGLPERRDVVADRGDDPEPGDGDATAGSSACGRGLGGGAPIGTEGQAESLAPPSFSSTLAQRSPTVVSSTRSSSGSVTPSSVSISPTICIIERESIPSSVITLWRVTWGKARRSTRSATCLKTGSASKELFMIQSILLSSNWARE